MTNRPPYTTASAGIRTHGPGKVLCGCAPRLSALPIAQRTMRGVVSRRAGHSAAWVCTCSTQIKSIDRRPVLRPAGDGAHEKKLLEREIAVKNVAFGEAVGTFKVERREHLPRDDRTRHVGRVLADLLHHQVAEQFALFVPGSFAEFVRHILNERGHHMQA